MNAKLLRALSALTALLISLGCCIEIKSCQPIAASISEIGTCRGYDEENWTPVGITDTFSVNDEHIYLYFYLESNVEVSLSYRWYHEDELWAVYRSGRKGRGYNFAGISPREGEQFPAGNYRVEVVLGSSVLGTAQFRVEE